MSKLYASVESDKGSRKVGKGGDEFISCEITKNNKTLFEVAWFEGNVHITTNEDDLPIVINGFRVQ